MFCIKQVLWHAKIVIHLLIYLFSYFIKYNYIKKFYKFKGIFCVKQILWHAKKSYIIIYLFYYFCFAIIFQLSDILIGFNIILFIFNCQIYIFFTQLVYVQMVSSEADSIPQVYFT